MIFDLNSTKKVMKIITGKYHQYVHDADITADISRYLIRYSHEIYVYKITKRIFFLNFFQLIEHKNIIYFID